MPLPALQDLIDSVTVDLSKDPFSAQPQLIRASDLGVLKKCKILKLNGQRIEHIGALGQLSQLEHLEAAGCKLGGDLSGLTQLESLAVLDLSQNNISDISFVKSFKKLKKLIIKENLIEDISPLGFCKDLAVLNFAQNAVQDASCLRACASLRQLDFSRNRIKEIRWLKELWFLESVTLGGNPLYEPDVDDIRGRVAIH